MSQHILAIDQGTTSTRAIVFDLDFQPRATAQVELQQYYPRPGWVEHDAEEIWTATLKVCRDVIEQAGGATNIAAIGITNQRETTVVWDRKTGAPVHKAIVWQDRRTSDVCAALREAGREPRVQETTGLLLDPYFSATKIAWILDRNPELRARAEKGELAFGTMETFLVWRLTNGRSHVSDVTNASRTLLYDFNTRAWSDEMCALFKVPRALLPQIEACDAHFGNTDASHFGRAIPIHGMAGDQQAALVGHGCFKPGMAKCTFGTGAFLVMNMGAKPPRSHNRLLGTVGYYAGGAFAYALEGSIFSAGATMQWLRDGLKLIKTSAESEAIASSLSDNGGVYLVPAFAGLTISLRRQAAHRPAGSARVSGAACWRAAVVRVRTVALRGRALRGAPAQTILALGWVRAPARLPARLPKSPRGLWAPSPFAVLRPLPGPALSVPDPYTRCIPIPLHPGGPL